MGIGTEQAEGPMPNKDAVQRQIYNGPVKQLITAPGAGICHPSPSHCA